MKQEKHLFSVIKAMIARRTKYFLKNMNHIDLNYDWWKSVRQSVRQEKMLKHQKCVFCEKGTKSEKTCILWQPSTILLLKQKLVEPQACFSSFWKLVMSLMYVSMYGYFSRHKIIIWSFKNQWFLNFNCVLLIIKLAEGLEFFFWRPWEIPLPKQLTFLRKKFITTSWDNLIILHGDLKCIL